MMLERMDASVFHCPLWDMQYPGGNKVLTLLLCEVYGL